MASENYKLKDGVTLFYDDETELKVVAGETVELNEEKVGVKTATALMSGAFVKVKTLGKGKAEKE